VQRSLLLFENSLKTEATREKYLYYLGKFKDFYKLKDYDSMITIPLKQLQIMVEDYVMMLKKKVSPNSVNTYMAGIEAFFETNDVELRLLTYSNNSFFYKPLYSRNKFTIRKLSFTPPFHILS